MTTEPPRLVMILGLQQRCGTNLLHDLLARHPDATGHGGIAEDFALHHAGHLEAYVRGVWGRWERDVRRIEGATDPRPALWRGFGATIESLLRAPESFTGRPPVTDRRWRVTKTPSVEHLPLLRRLFPTVPVLLLVRDGRAVVESLHQSFGWSYEESMWAWREGARRVLAAEQAGLPGVKRVRYEDLMERREETLREVFEFLGWPAESYDFAAATTVPVRGSSELRAREGRLHWEPRPVTPDFQPLRRGAGWPKTRRQRLHHLAAAELRALGYDAGPPPPAWQRPWHLLRDRWTAFLRGPWRRLGRRVRRSRAPEGH